MADAEVREANPANNFGTTADLSVVAGTGARKQSYLRFQVAGVSGRPIQSAVLRLNVNNSSGDGPAIYKALDASWTDNNLTWNNKPGITNGPVGDKGAMNKGAVVDYDVTSYIGDDGTFTLVLAMPTSNATDDAVFDSRESNPASKRPVLIITLGGSGVPTLTPGPTQAAQTQQQKIQAPTDTPTNTPVPPTSTPVPPTATPTNTPVPPTNTPTPIPPTNTPVPPTDTPVPPPPPTETPSG